MRFLVDEDLPRSTAKALSEAGYEVLDVRDVTLRGAKDREILTYACQNKLTIITADVGFGSLAYLSTVEHSGLVLLRLPSELPIRTVIETLLNALRHLSPEEITSSIIVVDQDKVRIRPKSNA
ncbi:MAG: DUF5615 family PIN-like protein [Syntrophomonadaceae bacterium]|nr:DUF5615 family PIN-like protein [Syntrophomonadaceae bacterium]